MQLTRLFLKPSLPAKPTSYVRSIQISYTAEIAAFCAVAGITVLDDISLLDRLRSGRK
jgi:hypothetical protein